MCSICGYFSDEKVPTRIVTDMLQKTEHRGPDAHGLYADGEIQGSSEISDLESSEKGRSVSWAFGIECRWRRR
jgi:asparagine synthetase B (glutamine-hydrolysing)